MREEDTDRKFAERVLARLPADPLPPRVERALLAGYDAWLAERDKGPWGAFQAGLQRLVQTIWPGAPLWAPAAAFAASLLVGAMIGTFLPAMSEMEPPGFSLEHTANFSLMAFDALQEDS